MSVEQAPVEEQNLPQDQGVTQDEVAPHQDEAVASENPEQSKEVVPTPEGDKEYNFRRMRQEMDNLQYENRRLKEVQEELAKPKGPSEEEKLNDIEEEIRQYAKDDLLTVEQAEKLNHVQQKRANLKLQQLEKQLNETAAHAAEQRVLSKYPDYFSVVTTENLEELKRSDPLIQKSLSGLTDQYDQACFLHEQIELRGLGNQDGREKRQLESNASKPRSTNSLGGTSPLHIANDYSGWPNKELKGKLFQEMQDAIKGAA